MSLQYYVLLENEVEEPEVLSLYETYRSQIDNKRLLVITSETVTQVILEEGDDPEWAEGYFDWHAKTQIIINTNDERDVNDESMHELFEFVSYLLDYVTGSVGFYVTGTIIYFERVNGDMILHNYPKYWLDEYLKCLNKPYQILNEAN